MKTSEHYSLMGFFLIALLPAVLGTWSLAMAADLPDLPHAFDAGWKGAKTCEVLYEAETLRVGRCSFPPGIGHEKHFHYPHFGYVLQGGTMQITNEQGLVEVREVITGSTWSTSEISIHEALNTGDTTTLYLIVEPKYVDSEHVKPEDPAAHPILAEAAPYVPDSGNMIIHCGRLIDGISAVARDNARIVIEHGRIVSVSFGTHGAADLPETDLPRPDLPELDLSGQTCLPGLIDMHTHILEVPSNSADLSQIFKHTLESTLVTGKEMSLVTLKAGFTAVRNVGTYYGMAEFQLRDLINAGEVIGPRMQAAGFYLTIPGGGGDLLTPGIKESDIPDYLHLGIARGPEQFRQKAQLAVDSGADLLKLIASGAVLAYGGVPGAPEMTPEEIAAAVQVGHAAGIRVTAHAHGAQSIREAILAGVDSIEHASLIDVEGIVLAREHDVALSMDIFNGDWIAVEGKKANWPEEFLRKNDETTLAQRQNFRKAHAAGVPIVFGSDAAVYPHGMNARQFAYMVEWGMSPMEAIQAATSIAARYMGWEDRIGSIAPGRFGDVIAVTGDPLQDIRVLEQVDVVVKGGLLFKLQSNLQFTHRADR